MAKNLKHKKESNLIINLAISTVPAVIVGYVFSDFIEDDVRRLGIVAFMLALVGILFIISDSYLKGKDSIHKVTRRSALIIGLGQVLALIPGTSRSGITILSAKARGLSSQAAAEYAFLMGIPVIFGATLAVLADSEARDYLSSNLGETIVGVFVAAAVGFLAIDFMLKYLKNHGLAVFGYYRIGLSLVLLLIMTTNG